jgi:hypothetical protein
MITVTLHDERGALDRERTAIVEDAVDALRRLQDRAAALFIEAAGRTHYLVSVEADPVPLILRAIVGTQLERRRARAAALAEEEEQWQKSA